MSKQRFLAKTALAALSCMVATVHAAEEDGSLSSISSIIQSVDFPSEERNPFPAYDLFLRTKDECMVWCTDQCASKFGCQPVCTANCAYPDNNVAGIAPFEEARSCLESSCPKCTDQHLLKVCGPCQANGQQRCRLTFKATRSWGPRNNAREVPYGCFGGLGRLVQDVSYQSCNYSATEDFYSPEDEDAVSSLNNATLADVQAAQVEEKELEQDEGSSLAWLSTLLWIAGIVAAIAVVVFLARVAVSRSKRQNIGGKKRCKRGEVEMISSPHPSADVACEFGPKTPPVGFRAMP